MGYPNSTTSANNISHSDLPPSEALNSYNNNNNYTSPNTDSNTLHSSGGGGITQSYNNMTPPSNLKCYDSSAVGYPNDYVRDMIEKISDKEQLSKAAYFYEKQISPADYYTTTPSYNNHGYDNPPSHQMQLTPTTPVATTHYDQNNNSNMCSDVSSRYDNTDLKKSGILAKFYKPDGTPLKSLWDSDNFLREQRAYKYDPKPLERRKNPRNFVPTDKKTMDYWEKRRKNNQAARKSREDRRKKEIEVLKSVNNLKSDNIKLKLYVQKIMGENQNLKYEYEMLKRL